MKRYLYILFLFLVSSFFLTGCGSRVHTSVSMASEAPAHNSPGVNIAILPLADYTAGFSPDDALRRQIKIESALERQLAAIGVYPAMGEDVIQCLADLGVIKIIEGPAIHGPNQFIARELASGWSEEMRREVVAILSKQSSPDNTTLATKKIGMDQGTLRAIGERLGVDYVLRGRIIEYELRDNRNLNPLQRGLLPFFFDTASATVFGVARSDTYDIWQDVALGGTLGAILGSSANHPFNAPSKKTVSTGSAVHPRLGATAVSISEEGGFDNSQGLNAGFWGAAVAGAAYLASQGGKVPEAVVQVGLALQDVRTGKILWADIVEKTVTPRSVWADSRERIQMDIAVQEAAKTLVSGLKPVLASLNTGESGRKMALNVPPSKVNAPKARTLKPLKPSQKKQEKSPEEWGS